MIAILHHNLLVEKIISLKRELENILEYRTEVAIVRSKYQWYNEGGKKIPDIL